MLISTLLFTSALAISGQVSGASLPQRLSRQESTNEPTCSGKEQGTTLTYSTPSGGAFDVLCGQDYAGGDFKALGTASFKDCLVACDAESACVTVAYRDGACYLKDRITSAISNEGVWSAKKQVIPTSTALSCDNNLSDGATYTASKGQFKIICGKEYPGGDLTSTSTATFEDCIEACAKNTQCIDVSYVNGACYLKQTLTTLSDVGYAWTAQLIGAQASVSSPSATPTGPAALTCLDNADNGKPYTTKSGKIFTVECGIDHAGGDLTSIDSTTFETCMDTCASTDGCVDVSWVYGTCYLKSTLNEGVALGHVWTGRLTMAQPSSAIATTSAQTSSLAVSETDFSSSTPSPVASSMSSMTLSSSSTSLTAVSTSSSSLSSASAASLSPSSSMSTTVSVATSTQTSTASSIQSSSATSSSAPPASTEFCLKVVTPGLAMSGEYVTQIGTGSNFVLGYSYSLLYFKLDESGRLLTTTGNIVAPVAYLDRAVNQPRQFTPAVVAASPSMYPPFICSITTNQTLKCTVTGTLFTNQYWSSQNNKAQGLIQIGSSLSDAPASRTFYELGVVAKEQCPSVGP